MSLLELLLRAVYCRILDPYGWLKENKAKRGQSQKKAAVRSLTVEWHQSPFIQSMHIELMIQMLRSVDEAHHTQKDFCHGKPAAPSERVLPDLYICPLQRLG